MVIGSLNHVGSIPIKVDLIHSSSPRSPFYNRNRTERPRISITRSWSPYGYLGRVSYPSSKTTPMSKSDLNTRNGWYVADVALGSPPTHRWFVVDSGSHISWTKCDSCKGCYPAGSSTYTPFHYQDSPLCSSGSAYDLCMFSVSYVDGSSVEGIIASEMFAIAGSSVPDVTLGCAMASQTKGFDGVDGLLALGVAPYAPRSFLYAAAGGKFSVCLSPMYDDGNSNGFGGKLVIGDASAFGALPTPMTLKPNEPFIYATLLGASLPLGDMIPIFGDIGADMKMDTGSSYSILPVDFLESIANSVSKVIGLPRVSPPSGSIFDYCFPMADRSVIGKLPIITFTFTGNGGVSLNTETAYVLESNNVFCLAFLSTNDIAGSVLGAFSMVNHLIGFDMLAKQIYFWGWQCDKF